MSFYTSDKTTHFKTGITDGITAIYVNIVLRRLALSLVSLFVPVFLFIKGREMWGSSIEAGLSLVFIYYVCWVLTKMLLVIPVANLIVSVGYRWTIALSNIFWAGLLILFYLAEENIEFLFIAPFVHAGATCLYWLSYHSLFAEDGHIKNLGKEVGLSQVIGLVASIAGPVMGGIIIDRLGFQSLFQTALFVIVLSGFPFFLLPHHKLKKRIRFGDVISWFKNKDHINEIVSVFGRNFEEKVVLVFWPIFVFLAVETYTKQGMIASSGTLLGALAVYWAGRLMDKKGNKRRFLFGVLATAITWVARSFTKNFVQILTVDIVGALVSPFYWVNFESLLYKDARTKAENQLLFMTARLFITGLSYLSVLLVLAIFMRSPQLFSILFFLAALGSIASFTLWEGRRAQ